MRALATQGSFVWAATSGGLDRYDADTRARTHFDAESGLDSLDVRAVRVSAGEVLVTTATGACRLISGRFVCATGVAPAADAPSGLTFHGGEVTSRAVVDAGTFVGTRGSGVWFLDDGDAARAERLDPASRETPRFVKKVFEHGGAVYLGTFDDGLWRVGASSASIAADPSLLALATRVQAPFRMVNDVADFGGALVVAANEGLFSSDDGNAWKRVELQGTHGVTGVAARRDTLFVATTAALFELRAGKRGPKLAAAHWRPAGSKSLQAVAVSGESVFIASEDRGVIRYDGATFQPFDRLSGLPTSWAVDVAGDGQGGAWVATLRDGVLHVGGRGDWTKVSDGGSDWVSSVARVGDAVCVGTQDGASCVGPGSAVRSFPFLPDRRAHAIAKLGDAWLVGTEAGTAIYAPTEAS